MNVNQNFDTNNQKIQKQKDRIKCFSPILINTTLLCVHGHDRIFQLHFQSENVLSYNCRFFTVQHHSPYIQLVVESGACFVHSILEQLVQLELVVSEGGSSPGLQLLLEEYLGIHF